MASDRQQFRDALRDWDQLHSDVQYSAPPNEGDLAILLPYNHAKHAKTEKVETFEYLTGQTLRLADNILRTTGRAPHVAIDATETDFKTVLTDPSISDVIVIGKGTFSGVEASTATGWIGWRTLGEQADHLKTGTFRQVICGSRRVNLNVPLGAFVVADHRNVFAPIDTYLPARTNLRRLSDKLQPVSDQSRMNWAYIKENFSEDIVYGRADLARARVDRIEQHVRNGRLGKVLRRKLSRIVDGLLDGEIDAQRAAE